MNLLGALVIGALVLASLESRHQNLTASLSVGTAPIPPPPYPPGEQLQMPVGGSFVDSIGAQKDLQLAANAANAIPVVGPFVSQAIKEIGGLLLGAKQEKTKDASEGNSAGSQVH